MRSGSWLRQSYLHPVKNLKFPTALRLNSYSKYVHLTCIYSRKNKEKSYFTTSMRAHPQTRNVSFCSKAVTDRAMLARWIAVYTARESKLAHLNPYQCTSHTPTTRTHVGVAQTWSSDARTRARASTTTRTCPPKWEHFSTDDAN